MKYALVRVLPDVPPGGVCAGIDWASADHAVCVVDLAGRVRDRFTAVHDRAGIAGLTARLRGGGAAEVAIERGDGVLVDALLAAGLTVVVIGSRQVKNLRSRYISSGGKDDRFDSFVLADTLRTDRARLRPLVPDSPATIALRAAVRARRDLVAHRVSACNQLRAHLAVAFPGAIGLFSELDSPVSLAFLAAFPGQQAAARLDEQALAAWLATVPRRGNTAPAQVLAARLAAAPRGAAGADAAQAAVTAQLAAATAGLAGRVRALEAEIAAQLAVHPGPGRCAPPGCWPRPATAAPATPTPGPWPAWPASRPSPAGRAPTSATSSAGTSTASSATRSVTSPTDPGTPAPGPPPSTPPPATAARTTRTPSASPPAPGC
jgi:transposase